MSVYCSIQDGARCSSCENVIYLLLAQNEEKFFRKNAGVDLNAPKELPTVEKKFTVKSRFKLRSMYYNLVIASMKNFNETLEPCF